MQSAAGPSNCRYKKVNFSIPVKESSESTAAVNVSMDVVHFKRSPLKAAKLNFSNFIPCALTGAAQLALFTFDKLSLIFIDCSSFDIFCMVRLMLYSISSHWTRQFLILLHQVA